MRSIRHLIPEISHFTCDFEKAVWKCIRELYPLIKLRGCNFHFCQAIWKHVCDIGLKTAFNKNMPVRIIIRKFMALAYLKSEDIR